MKSNPNSILVQCKGIYEYMVSSAGGSLQLYVDPLYKEGSHKVTYGTVICIPEIMPANSVIVPEVKVGDKIYFHYNSLDAEAMVPDTEGIFMIPYDMVFCALREGVLIPIAGKVLCKPYFDPDIVEMEVGGVMMKCKLTKSGIIKEINVRHNLKQAVLTHIGTPLMDAKVLDVKVGEVVWYALDADFENVIEGETYFVMDQELLLMVE